MPMEMSSNYLEILEKMITFTNLVLFLWKISFKKHGNSTIFFQGFGQQSFETQIKETLDTKCNTKRTN